MFTSDHLRLFTSESVTEGHPDKICDQISDAILDALLAKDPESRVAVETLTTTGLVQVAGEVTTDAYVEIPEIVRETILDLGYDSSANGFDGARCGVNISIGQQSQEISSGVFSSLEQRLGKAKDPRDISRVPATRASCSVTRPTRTIRSCRPRSTWRTVSRSS